MTAQREDPTWRAASHGSARRRWGVARFAGRQWLEDSLGRTRWFATRKAAQAVADKENAR